MVSPLNFSIDLYSIPPLLSFGITLRVVVQLTNNPTNNKYLGFTLSNLFNFKIQITGQSA